MEKNYLWSLYSQNDSQSNYSINIEFKGLYYSIDISKLIHIADMNK